jgi:adenylate kinase family enzyme
MSSLWYRRRILLAYVCLFQKLCREVLYKAIHSLGAQSWGYVIEGYPRSISQAEDFDNTVEVLKIRKNSINL